MIFSSSTLPPMVGATGLVDTQTASMSIRFTQSTARARPPLVRMVLSSSSSAVPHVGSHGYTDSSDANQLTCSVCDSARRKPCPEKVRACSLLQQYTRKKMCACRLLHFSLALLFCASSLALLFCASGHFIWNFQPPIRIRGRYSPYYFHPLLLSPPWCSRALQFGVSCRDNSCLTCAVTYGPTSVLDLVCVLTCIPRFVLPSMISWV